MPDPRRISLLVLDVDGVLTDGTLMFDGAGNELKRFSTRDGCGIRAWLRLGLEAAIITGRVSPTVERRGRELGIEHIVMGSEDKGEVIERLMNDLGREPDEVAVVADDLPDLPMLRACGYPIAVGDAVAEVQALAAFVTTRNGGHGAVREAIEHLLRAQDRWDDAVALFDRVAADDPA